MIYDDSTWQPMYYISYILNKPKYQQLLDHWMKHETVIASKKFGWICELCHSRSTFKPEYKHTLLQRVQWHINGRCPAEKEIKEAEWAVIPL